MAFSAYRPFLTIVQYRYSVLSLLALLCGCGSFGPPSVSKAFEGRPAPIIGTLALPEGRVIQFAETGNRNGIPVLMIHGSPGAWNDYAYVMADEGLAQSTHLISVDRLGWGGSATGGLEPSLSNQAASLHYILQNVVPGRKAIVVGHSYGAPVAAQFAMQYPDLVAGLILVAGSIDPDLEEPTWFQEVGRWAIIRWAVPEILIRADEEIKPLKSQLEGMVKGWPKLNLPVIVIQGDDDSLVPRENADFAERALSGASVAPVIERIPDQGHLIPWERPDLIVAGIRRIRSEEAGSQSSEFEKR